MSIGKSIFLTIRVKFFFFTHFLKSIKYYLNLRFLLFDLLFSLAYFFLNPYRISRKFLEKKFNKKIYDYGETPIIEMEKMIKFFKIPSNTTFLELGAGRGKMSFWLYFFFKCKVIAIEQIPIFVKIANFFIKLFRIKKIEFLCKDMFTFDLKDVDIIYLYGTTLPTDEIKTLINKFKKLSARVKIITISYTLNQYDKDFISEKSFDISFPWGKTKAYLNIKGEKKCF
ncbi:MAG: hypothetical protein K940chlam5_00733 [Candidatus Anoxychlamydiales bacterium]|nr:hypothetical protein [Candidatus Anoxychlamydiales bacterium]